MYRRLHVIGLAATVVCLAGCVPLDFSPDGKQLVVDWKDGLAIVNTDGTGYQQIPNGRDGGQPLWSPDGKSILFKVEGKGDLFVYRVAEKRSIKIGSDYCLPIAWREDGRRFAAFHGPVGGPYSIISYDLGERGITHRMSVPAGLSAAQMVWLPNTDNVAFIGVTRGKTDIFTAEEGELHRITNTGDVIGLGLSGDRKKLVWARKSANLRYILMSVYAYGITSRSSERLPFPDRIPLLNPDPRHAPEEVRGVAFSPDGTRLALVATMRTSAGSKPPNGVYAICCSVGMDGSGARIIHRSMPETGQVEAVLYPTWSKDGRQLALYTTEGPYSKIAVFNPDGTNGRKVLTSP